MKMSNAACFIFFNGLLLVTTVHLPHVKCIVGDQLSPQGSTGTIG